MIEQFYLTHKSDPINITALGLHGPESNGNEKVLHFC